MIDDIIYTYEKQRITWRFPDKSYQYWLVGTDSEPNILLTHDKGVVLKIMAHHAPLDEWQCLTASEKDMSNDLRNVDSNSLFRGVQPLIVTVEPSNDHDPAIDKAVNEAKDEWEQYKRGQV